MGCQRDDVLIDNRRFERVEGRIVVGIRAVNSDATLVDGFILVAPDDVINIANKIGVAVPGIEHRNFTTIGQAALPVYRTR